MSNDIISRRGLFQAIRTEKCLRGYAETYIPMSELETALDKATVKNGPNVYADWLPRNPDDPGSGTYYCSHCKADISSVKSLYYKFCPECGSIMNIGVQTTSKDKPKKREWMVHIWGGAWNADANPSIEKDLGIKAGTYYFPTKEKKDEFVRLLQNPIYSKQGLMIDAKWGVMTHKRTIFVGTFEYKGKEFTVHVDMGYEYPEDSAIFMFTTGNYGCDCNRSMFIRSEYGEDAIPDLDCGGEIELVDYHFEYED